MPALLPPLFLFNNNTQFVSQWTTSRLSTGSTGLAGIRLPLLSDGAYDFTVDWGDGSSDTITQWDQAEVEHLYPAPGTYTVTIAGEIFGWAFNGGGDALKIDSVDQWGDLRLSAGTGEGGYFEGCRFMDIRANDRLSTTGIRNFRRAWYNCRIVNFPPVPLSEGLDFRECWAWSEFEGRTQGYLETFPALDVSSGADFSGAWRNQRLTEFPELDLTNALNVSEAFMNNELGQFPLLNLVQATDLSRAWKDNPLTSIPNFRLFSATNLSGAWDGCRLEDMPLIDTSRVTDFSFTWRGNPFTTFPRIDTRAATTVASAWEDCPLNGFPSIDTRNVADFTGAWRNCDLTSFPFIHLLSAQTLEGAWERNRNLRSFPLVDTSRVVNFRDTWRDNDLDSFPAINTASARFMSNTWRDNRLTEFPLINTSQVVEADGAWRGNQLTSFPILDLSAATTVQSAWQFNDLAVVEDMFGPDNVLVNASSAWSNNRIVQVAPLTLPAIENFSRALEANLLVNFTVGSMRPGVDVSHAWENNNLTSFEIPELDDFRPGDVSHAWRDNELPSFPTFRSGLVTSFAFAWFNNHIDDFPLLDIDSALSFDGTWGNTYAYLPGGFNRMSPATYRQFLERIRLQNRPIAYLDAGKSYTDLDADAAAADAEIAGWVPSVVGRQPDGYIKDGNNIRPAQAAAFNTLRGFTTGSPQFRGKTYIHDVVDDLFSFGYANWRLPVADTSPNTNRLLMLGGYGQGSDTNNATGPYYRIDPGQYESFADNGGRISLDFGIGPDAAEFTVAGPGRDLIYRFIKIRGHASLSCELQSNLQLPDLPANLNPDRYMLAVVRRNPDDATAWLLETFTSYLWEYTP